MIHRLETTDGSIGQLLRPVGMMNTLKHTHRERETYTRASQSTNPIPPQPHFKSEHVLLLNVLKHEFCFKLLIVSRIHLFSQNVFDLNSQRRLKIASRAQEFHFHSFDGMFKSVQFSIDSHSFS